MMKKIFLAFFVLISIVSSAQRLQKVNTYGYEYNRVAVDSLFALPADTFSVPAYYQSYPWVTRKGTTLYLWNTSAFVWEALTAGSSTDTTSLSNRIDQKQNIADTNTVDATRYWVQQQGYADSLRRVGINVQMRKNGNWTTQYIDSVNAPDSKRFGVTNEDTAASTNRLFDLNGYNFKFKNGYVKLSSKDSIGNVFTYNWSNNPLSVWWDESSATVTTDGTGTTFTGGSPATVDGYGLTYFNNFYFTGPNMTFSTKVVVKQKNNSSTGFGFKFSPRFGGITYISHFMLSDTTGYVSFTNDNMPNSASVKSSTSGTFKWDVDDTLLAKVVFRAPYYAEAILTNLKTGIEASVKIPGAVVQPWSFKLTTYGGEFKMIDTFKISYDDVYQADVMIMGNSITFGDGASSYDMGYAYKATSGANAIIAGYPSRASIDGTLTISDVVNIYKPKNYMWAMGVNDVNGFVTADSLAARTERSLLQIKAGLPTTNLFVGGIVPQSSASVAVHNDSLRAVALRLGAQFIDFYTLLKGTGTNINTIYYLDGIHPNQNGHNVMAQVVRYELSKKISFESPLNLSSLPIASDSSLSKWNLGIGEDGNVYRVKNNVGNSYIRNYDFTSTSLVTSAQNSSIFIKKDAGVNGLYVFDGYSSPANAPFSVRAGYVRSSLPILMSGGGVEVNTNAINLSGTSQLTFNGSAHITSLNANTISFFNKFLYNGAGSVGFNFTNSNFAPTSSYKIAQFSQYNGSSQVVKAFIDRAGGYHSDTLLQYNSNLSSLIGANDRNVPDVGWVNNAIADAGIYTNKQDTITLATFTAGAGLSADTAIFQTSTIYGSFYNDGSDTLVITKQIAILQGSSPSITPTLYWNDSLNVTAGAVKLINSPSALTNTSTGTSVTSFDNYKIPPGVWVWVSTQTVGTKPTYFSLSLIGYKK